jgi:hypothetical protein
MQVWSRSQVLEFPSSRDPKLLYKVTVYGTDAECTCPGFEYRGTCKHVLEVKRAGR